MSTKTHALAVSGIEVNIVRKDIKNLHLAVYPPDGRVRVAAPLTMDDDAVRMAVVMRLPWIRRWCTSFATQERESRREYVSGESHYYLGQRYLLNVIEHNGGGGVAFRTGKHIDLFVKEGSDRKKRERVFQRWCRNELHLRAAPIVQKWVKHLRLSEPLWGIKRMKTRWGSCNTKAGRIWLNLELIKKPSVCLDYIVVHELVHLLERHHNDRFVSTMDKAMPLWRSNRDVLNSAPLAYEDWSCRCTVASTAMNRQSKSA